MTAHRGVGRTDDPGQLRERLAIITGAGRGVGRAAALALARSGAQVALMARSPSELEETARQIRLVGGAALAVPVDLRHPAELAAAVDRVRDWSGNPQILINNAASLGPLGPSTEVPPAEFVETLLVNVIATIALTHAVLPDMLSRRWGRIVNVSSGAAASPTAMIGANAYTTSKAALEAHTLNLAAELEGSGVTVNAYRPGMVDTEMQARLRQATLSVIRERARQVHEQGALLTPEESARGLITRLATGMTGQVWSAADPA